MEYRICQFCSGHGKYEDTSEKKDIPCNVEEFQHESYPVWRCSECDCLHSLYFVDLDKYYANYPMKKQKLDFHTRQMLKRRLNLLIKYGLRKSDKILDYGCGSGLFIQFLHENGYESAFGYDPFNPEFSSETLLEEHYNFLTSQDVIEHEDDLTFFLDRVKNLLDPERGVVAIGTPDAAKISLTSRLDQVSHLHQPYHRHLLTVPILKKLLSDRQLNWIGVERISYLDTWWPFMNYACISRVWQKTGNIDISFKNPFDFLRICLLNPVILASGFFGRFWPDRKSIIVFASSNK